MAYSITTGIDAREGAALARSVGWETTEGALADILDAVKGGAFTARDATGAAIGMITCAIWDDLAWVGTMVVAEHARRQGSGRDLLRRALDHAREHGANAVGLDATPAGRALYEREGFRAAGESAFWARDGPRPASATPGPSGEYAIYPVSAAEIMELIACDKPRFGASRGPWLAKLMSDHPQQAFVAVHRKSGAFSGHVLSMGDRIGPFIADAPEAAAWLLHAIERAGVPARAIVPSWNPDAPALFRAAGYVQVRACTRMWLGEPPSRGRPETLYGIGAWALG